MFGALIEEYNLVSKTAYNDVAVLHNPITSGKTFKVWLMTVNTVSATGSRFELVVGSTFTVGTGIAVPIANMLVGSPIISTATLRTGITITSIGIPIKEVSQTKGAFSLEIPIDFTLQLPPGKTLHIRGLPDAANALVSISLKWMED